ncbi:MAG TPA: alpha/beta hydrolase [Candidatus Acidoferrum sp.]|nr:alpha/beta hydrolase [Candidatus Acidoferrum sp.]
MPVTTLEVKRERSLKRATTWIFGSFVLLIGALLIAGACYQAIGEHRDRDLFPQVGRSINIGSLSLNLNCSGKGRPAVILESGLGIPSIGWALVQPKVAQIARVCSYDRAGYGWSDPVPFPRTSSEIARELHALLMNAHVAPPYILVGHSFGGFNVRLFNQLYPSEVAGVVFVDASQEDAASQMSDAMKAANAKSLRQLLRMDSIVGFLIDFGIERAAIRRSLLAQHIPSQLLPELAYLEAQKKYVDAISSERESFDQSAEEARAAGDFGDKPLIVLTAGNADGGISGVPQRDANTFFDAWVGQLQPRLVDLSTNGSQLVLLNSDHLIPFEQPQAIVDAVKEVIEDLREHRNANGRHRI